MILSKYTGQTALCYFSALINNIQELRNVVADEDIDDGELYEAEQSLNDYVTVLARDLETSITLVPIKERCRRSWSKNLARFFSNNVPHS